jgi:hypothetical protein
MRNSRFAARALVALATVAVAAIAFAARDQLREQGTSASLDESPTFETDARRGEPPLPLTAGEQEKMAAARAAVDAAEAAGTRWVAPFERPEVTFGADAEAAKLERLRTRLPDESPQRPGIAEGGTGGSP